MQEAPAQAGIDLVNWNWKVVRQYVWERFGISLSRRSCLTQKVRESGRIVNVCLVMATGVNADGQHEILGLDVGASEDGAFWLAFLCSLTA